MIMTPKNPGWEKFYRLLEGKEGCDFREDPKKKGDDKVTWKCKGGMDKTFARKILKKHFPKIDIEKTVKYFDEHGGHCDCEILFNVEATSGVK